MRLYQLSQIPREILEERLGYDIPPVPELSIAGIKARSALLYWLNSQENGFAAVTLSVLVNGIKRKPRHLPVILANFLAAVGEFVRGEASIEILHLKPGCCYNIKVLATNSANLTTLTPAIRIQTLRESATNDISGNNYNNEPATIRTAPSPLNSRTPQPLVKENSNPQQSNIKSITKPRNLPMGPIGPIAANEGHSSSDSDEDDSPEYIQRLTDKLESLKRQKDEVDKQIEDEEAEARSCHYELAKERDQLRQELREKEESSNELRRQGNQLDKLNRTAQSKRAAKERLLHQKRAEHQKVQGDVRRWDQEIIEMEQDIENMEKELDQIHASKDGELADLRQAVSEDHAVVRNLEDEIRVRGAQIKDLEQQRDQINTEYTDDHGRSRAEKAKDDAWDVKYQAMQVQLQSMWHAVQQSKMEEQQAEDHLAWWITRRARNPEQFVPIPSLDAPPTIQRNKSRRARQTSSRTSTLSNSGHYGSTSAYTSPPPYSTNIPVSQAGPITNTASGIEQNRMSQIDVENLTGGAFMSPAVNDLLPSNLFRDEEIASRQSPLGVGEGDGDVGGLNPFFGHAMSNSDASVPGPHTPRSASSRTGSIFTSPHDSMQNLPMFPQDSDRQSIASTNAPFTSALNVDTTSQPSSRLSTLFSSPFSRQRVKPNVQEPPALGTLKQGQSQSFPRNLEPEGLDSSGLRRRRGSHGTWANPMAGLLARNNTNPDDHAIRARTGSGRSSRLNLFKPRMDALDPNAIAEQDSSHSRPSSTYSYEQPFGRPSGESQNIWGPFGDNAPSRSSPLNANWTAHQGPWSRGPSRRPSVQHGSSTNLSIGSTPLDADDIPGSLSKYRSEQAPIGTRPRSQRGATPRLNPAAPSFKTLFTRDGKRNIKGDKIGSKNSEFPRGRESERGDTDENESIEDASPPNPRLSRDAQSITTAASTADSHESFERTTSGATSDVTPKESLMQKITRKSSSSKFNVPWSKDRGIFSKRAGEPSTPGELDEDNCSEGQLGRSADSAVSAPHTPREEKAGRAWPSIRRKSRKGIEAVEKGSEAGDEEEQA